MKSINDNKIQSLDLVCERDLHAYIDGRLDARRRERIENYLERHPAIAEEVYKHIEYNDMIKSAYEDILHESTPPHLMNILNRPVQRVWPRVAKVAAVIALCAFSAGSGWLSAHLSDRGAPSQYIASPHQQMDQFLAQIVNENAIHHSVSYAANDASLTTTDPMNWLTQKVALEMQAPNLMQVGFQLQDRRLVTHGQQEFVELTYADQDGRAMHLYMKTRWEQEPPAVEFYRHNGTSVAHWQEGPLVYALSGSFEEGQALDVADLVRQSMSASEGTSNAMNSHIKLQAETEVIARPDLSQALPSSNVPDTVNIQPLMPQNVNDHGAFQEGVLEY